MATSTFRNKNKVRPIKNGAAKRARVKAQRKRLVGLGFSAEEAATVQSDKLHAYLLHPEITKKQLAQRAAWEAQKAADAQA